MVEFSDMMAEVIRELDALSPGEKRQRIQTLAVDWGVTETTVYRRLKTARECGRRTWATRADSGVPRVLANDEMLRCIKVVMGLKTLDPGKPDKRIGNPNKAMPTARAIEIAEQLGEIPAGVLHPRTVNRWARRYGITSHDICSPTPAIRLKANHPNHVHVVDFSVCEQYYLRDSDGKVLSRTWTYKNKPNESKQKIWTFAIVDHHSTVKYIKYFLSSGESSYILFQGLTEAWGKKDDSQFPFHGAPLMLYADRGSALMSDRIQNFLAALGVKSETHLPGNPRAKSMVESSFKHFQVGFETELRLCPASSIKELNDRAYNWLVNHNWSAKTGEKRTRFAVWRDITPEQLLELPPMDLLRRVAATGDIRTVDKYCTVRYKNVLYGVPPELVGKKVRVWTDIDGGISVQDIVTGDMHQTSEPKSATFGEFNAFRKTDVQRNRDDALEIASGLRKSITPDILRRETPNRHAFPATGTPIEVDSDLVADRPTGYDTIGQAKLAIADIAGLNLGDLPGWMMDEIEDALRDALDYDHVREIARYVGDFMNEQRNAV